jgi:hypothetical protein
MRGWPGGGTSRPRSSWTSSRRSSPRERARRGRQEFVAALAALSERTLVVTGLRADFYSHALNYPALARALQERQIVVGPMSAGQLRRAIVEPAHKAGLDVEDGLVEVLLADMRPYGAAGPGAGGHPGRPAAEGAPLTGFTGYVHAVAFSPSGRLLAAGSADKTVRLCDVSDPARPRLASKPLTGPADIVNSLAFSPDGKELAAAVGNDDKVWRWNIANPVKPAPLTRLRGATNWIMAVAFSPGGQVLAEGGSDDKVRLWSTATGAPLAVIPEPQPVTSLTWDGPGLLVAGDADGYVRPGACRYRN